MSLWAETRQKERQRASRQLGVARNGTALTAGHPAPPAGPYRTEAGTDAALARASRKSLAAMAPDWTPAEDDRLAQLWPDTQLTIDDVAARMPARTADAVRCRAVVLGLTRGGKAACRPKVAAPKCPVCFVLIEHAPGACRQRGCAFYSPDVAPEDRTLAGVACYG